MSTTTAGRNIMVQGRIVWVSGNLFTGRIKTVFGTNTPQKNDQGENKMEYGFGLAIPKANIQEIWNAMHEEAWLMYPSRQFPPTFAMKYKDGDTSIDDDGKPYSLREGYPGCMVVSCTTSIPIKYFRLENGQNYLVSDGIKCGDYVNVQLTIKAHGPIGQGKPGLYMNPNAVQFLGHGKEIINAPSGDQIFGTNQLPLPPGASAVPIASNPNAMLVPPGGAQMPPPMAPPQGQYPQQSPVIPQQQQPAPHYGVIPQQHQPPPGGQPMAPQMPGYPQQGAPMPQQPNYPPQQPAYPPPQQPQQGYAQQPGQPGGMPAMPGYPQQR